MNSLLILAVILSGNSSNLPCSACMSFIDNPYGGTLVADGGALGQLNIVGPPPVNQSFGGKICLDPMTLADFTRENT